MEFLTAALGNISIANDQNQAGQPCCVVSTGSEFLKGSIECLQGADVLALDCEGVNLGRGGSVCIVQLATRDRCFLFDVNELTPESDVATALKPILENKNIVKVIHDCKQDADALLHLLGITLVNVHDTQCWDVEIRNESHNLNNTLTAYGIETNSVRDGSVYKTNPAFWATRPLTPEMIAWASGDVTALFQLYELQRTAATEAQAEAAKLSSEYNSRNVASMKLEIVYINPENMGWFIGKGGSNVKRLTQRLAGCIHVSTTHVPGQIHLYVRDKKALKTTLKLLEKYK